MEGGRERRGVRRKAVEKVGGREGRSDGGGGREGGRE